MQKEHRECNILSQNQWVLSHLKKGEPITSLQAIQKIGCTRLAARIEQLRTKGYAIDTRMIRVCNRSGRTARVAEYRLAEGVTQ